MAIPAYKEMKKPILEHAAKFQRAIHKTDFYEPLFNHFQATEEEKVRKYDSDNGFIFINRIAWALSELFKEGLLQRAQRGFYSITDDGRSFLAGKPVKLNGAGDQTTENPVETLHQSFAKIQREVCDEILMTILEKSPYEFEKIVLRLLQKMGYGGSVEDSGHVTPKSNDGGIDVEIKEDILGLDRIHVQAKRYQRDAKIGSPEIHQFAGALDGKANKGIFVTTAQFTKGAYEYAESRPQMRIVLIDGDQLAKYIYQYDFGMQTDDTFHVKRLDSDFWDTFLNDTRDDD